MRLNVLPDFWPPVVGLDIETEVRSDRSDVFQDRMVTIQVGCPEVYVFTKDFGRLSPLLTDPTILKVIHNAKFDTKFIKHNLGVLVQPIWDTFLAERLLTAGMGVACDLASTIWRRVGVLIDKNEKVGKSFKVGVLTDEQSRYVENDVRYLQRLYRAQMEEVDKCKLGKVCHLEHDLLPVVVGMELLGVHLSTLAWGQVVEEEKTLALRATMSMCDAMGLPPLMPDLFGGYTPPINLNSWQQVLPALVRVGIVLENARDEVLETYLKSHPDCVPVRAWRDYKLHTKRISWSYPKYVHPVTSRVHTDYHQIGADTGRFSSSNPNLQNIPRESSIRRIFVPKDGHSFICADYAQQEMRVMAEMSGDENLRKVCMEQDPHLANARVIWKDPGMKELKGEKRVLIKNTGFAMNYGAGPETFATSCGIGLSEAKRVLGSLKRAYPKVFSWGEAQLEFLKEYGYIETILGRKRYFLGVQDDVNELKKQSTKARNGPIQGTSADMLKLAMVRVDRILKNYHAYLVLTIHDELVVEVEDEQATEVAEIVSKEMSLAGEELVKSIPCPADIEITKYLK